MSGMGGGAGRRIHAIEGSPFGPYPLSQTIREPVMKHINFHVLCLATFIVAPIAFGFAVSHAATADAVQAPAGPSSMLPPYRATPRATRPRPQARGDAGEHP